MARSDENYDDIKKILSNCAFMANIKTRKIITKTTTLIIRRLPAAIFATAGPDAIIVSSKQKLNQSITVTRAQHMYNSNNFFLFFF